MKKVGVLSVVCLFILSLNFVLADIDVYNFTFKDEYSPFQLIEGEVNMSIFDVDFISVLSSNLNDDVISLEDFLDENVADYDCVPVDCSSDYDYSSGLVEKTISVSSGEKAYAGFVLNGDNVEVTGLSFDLESDFGRANQKPLRIEFFESDFWEYAEFSDEYSSKDYGCFQGIVGLAGQLIGAAEYCETITLPETNSFELGAEVNDGDTKSLKMSIYSDTYSSALNGCEFNPTTEESCTIYADSEETYDAGEYYVCVSSGSDGATNYRLFNESAGANCGFVYSSPNNLGQDYAVFAQAAFYEAAETSGVSNLQISAGKFDEFVVYANGLLNERYEGNCSGGCVLPFAVEGVFQNLVVKNLALSYQSKRADQTPENKIYDLEVDPALVEFSGVLNLKLLGFSVGRDDDEFTLFLDDDEIFVEDIKVLPAPIVVFVYPTNPPAGVPVTFYAGVDYNGTIESYKWDFGDGTKGTTGEDSMVHTYADLGNYTIELEVIAKKNMSNSASFEVEAVNPKVAIDASLKTMKVAINDVVKDINKFPVWYQEKLEDIVEVIFYQGELKRLEKDYNDSFDDEGYVEVAKEVYVLDVPESVWVVKKVTMPLLTDLDDIDAEPVQMIGGGNEENLAGYKNPILRWQTENIDAKILMKKIVLSRESGQKEDVMMVYSVNVKSNADEEGFFVIGKNFNNLFFNSASDVNPRKEGESTVIVLPEGEEESFKFYYLAEGGGSLDEVAMFASPKLSHLVLEADIDTTCNFNKVCEKSLGEDSSTCRSDCKPIFRMILYIILVFVFILILYTALQVWYKTKYEKHLFKDRRQLYNLLMFIANARARGRGDDKGMDDNQIIAALKKQKWNNEQINYALRKSRGERTGMYEIIPVEKVFAKLRQRKAQKKVAMQAANPIMPGGIKRPRLPRK